MASSDGLTVHTIGRELPLALLRACGLQPVRLQPDRATEVRELRVALTHEGRRYLQAVAAAPVRPLLLATGEPGGAMLFAVLRELMRVGQLAHRPLHGVDLLRPRTEAVVQYNRTRLEALAGWAASLGGRWPDAAQLRRELADGPVPAARDPLPGESPDAERVFVAGAEAGFASAPLAFQELGWWWAGDDLLLGQSATPLPLDDPWDAIARSVVQPSAIEPEVRAQWTLAQAKARGATRVVHLWEEGDEAHPWLNRCLGVACSAEGIQLTSVPVRGGETPAQALCAALARAPGERATALAEPSRAVGAPSPANRPRADGARSRKSLKAVADFSAYQRDWFQRVRARALAGEPFAVINADAPQEILRAFDIPFVVNQWWASIVAAKQQSARYLDLLRRNGFPTDAEPYSAQGLAAALDEDLAQAPWGGLPRPQWLLAFNGTAATRGIYTAWAKETGAQLALFDRTVDTRAELPIEWWERMPHEWDELLEKPRLDLTQAQFAECIARLEQSTGRRFDAQRFTEIMDLVNEQEAFYRKTRDLIARCSRAPVGIVDTMPATMVPQWHRGTPWGRDAARALYEEVERLASSGAAACEDERLRLMWVGRGLWSDMGFYQRWEQSHGAVFVWSMYLALAADGYLRYCRDGQSPLRALAARFVSMGDELRMPTWAGAWHVHEARTHRVHAAVAIDDADPLVLAALERAGVPVLRLDLNNFGAGATGADAAAGAVTAFLDRLSGS